MFPCRKKRAYYFALIGSNRCIDAAGADHKIFGKPRSLADCDVQHIIQHQNPLVTGTRTGASDSNMQ